MILERHTPLHGLVAATHTPFLADGSFNLAVVEKQVAHLLGGGVKFAIIGGTTGECSSLTLEERHLLTTRWTEVALRDPGCNASVLRYSFGDGASSLGRILYSGPDAMTRSNGTIHLSRDDGATWPVKRVLWPGSFAYSVLTKLPDGEVGCLFETDNYERIVFARVPETWVEAGKAQ